MARIRIALAAIVVFTASSMTGSDVPRFWSFLEKGPHEIGFRLLQAESMTLLPNIPTRPIEVAVWYPATRGDAKAMTFGDYVQCSPDFLRRSTPEGVRPDDLEAILSAAISGKPDGISEDLARAILATPMAAKLDAEAAEGRFPVAFWSTRYGTTAAQSVLSEYLASHGYVVGFARPSTSTEVMPFEAKTAEAKADEMEWQLVDMRGGLAALRALPFADQEQTAILAWSYAGEAATRMQRTDTRVDLVIGYSSNTISGQWPYQGAAALDALGSGPLEVPHVVFTEAAAPDGTTRVRPAVWSSLPAGSAFVTIPGVAHGSFNVVEGLIPSILGIETVQPWSKAGPAAREAYAGVARATRALLDARLRQSGSLSKERLEALLPKGSTVEIRMPDSRKAVGREAIEIPVEEGVALTAELYRAPSPKACALLFHQSGSSRGEYRGIAPWLVRHGITALAVDLRMGREDRWNGVVNESAMRSGVAAASERGDRETIQRLRAGIGGDIRKSIAWLASQDGCSGRVIPWGSSSSANRVVEVSVGNDDVIGVVSFSPGEYDSSDPEKMRRIAKTLDRPALVVWGRGEGELSAPVADVVPGRITTHASALGFHGSSILFEDPEAWVVLSGFLESLAKP